MLLLVFAAASSFADAPRRPMPPPDRAVIQSAVGERLRDAESARYRWPLASPDPDEVGYCGFVNAKNAFGAYVGFRPFFVLGYRRNGPRGDGRYVVDQVHIAAEDAEASAAAVVERMCREIGYDISRLPPD